MKNVIGIILLLLSTTLIQAQNKDSIEAEFQETVDWLESKVKSYQYSDENISHNYNLMPYKIDGTYYLTLMVNQKMKNLGTNFITIRIPLDKIIPIDFKEFDETYFLTITTKEQKDLILYTSTGQKPKYINHYDIVLKKSLDNENLKERINKAFNDLIKLSGGNKNEKY